MRKAIGLLSVLLLASGWAWAESQPVSLGEAARRVRAQRAGRDLSRVPVFTNENLPRGAAGFSVLGTSASGSATEAGVAAGAEGKAAAGEDTSKECDEKCWRGKFREARSKIREAEREVDILQREYNLARTQFYQDPNQAVREQYSGNTAGGRELQEILQKMDAKKAAIAQLKRELSNLEDQLRREGGQPGWARE